MKTTLFNRGAMLRCLAFFTRSKVMILVAVCCLMARCSDQDDAATPPSLPQDPTTRVLTEFLAREFAVAPTSIKYIADRQLFAIDGDLLLTRAGAESYFEGSRAAQGGRSKHWRSTGLVGQNIVTDVRVRISSGVPNDWTNSIRTAITHWNGVLGTKLTFREVSSSEHVTVTVDQLDPILGPNAIAGALLPPGNSQPGSSIIIDVDFLGLAANNRLNAMAHELGHTIGLRHTNETLGVFINGTPATDPNSVMHATNSAWAGFTAGDIAAVQILYPYHKEEIYTIEANTMWATDHSTGNTESVGTSNWPGAEAMASNGTYVFVVQGNEFWRFDPADYHASMVSLGSGWSGTEAMTSSGSYIFTAQGDHLWRTDVNGNTSDLGSGWSGTEVMAATNGYIFAVQGDNLWRTDANNSSPVSMGTGWSGSQAMTAFGGYVYTVHGDELWKTDAITGATASLGSGWNGTSAMTNYNGYIYAIQGGEFWRTDTSNSNPVSLGSGWNSVACMTAAP